MKVYYLTNTDKFIDIKIKLAFLPKPVKINSIDEFFTKNDTWKLFINLTDNNLFFHNEFIYHFKKINFNEKIYFFDERYLIKDTKCFLVHNSITKDNMYSVFSNTTYSYLTTWGLNYGSFNYYQLINYKFEDELTALYKIFINKYPLFFSQKQGFRYKFVFDFEKHIFKYYKPFIFLITVNNTNYLEMQKLVSKLSELDYPYFRIIIMVNTKSFDEIDFKFKNCLIINTDCKSHINLINFCSSIEYVIFPKTHIINLFKLNKIHEHYPKYYSKDYFSVNVFYYIENTPIVLSYNNELEIVSNDHDINFLVNLDDKTYCQDPRPTNKRHIYKFEDKLFPRLKKYLIRKDIQEGLKIVYQELEKVTTYNMFNALVMILVSFLAIAEDTASIEKELFRASIVFKNDHETFRSYLIILENNESTISPKFKKLFYNKALEFKEFNHRFKCHILARLLVIPDIENTEMQIYIDTFREIYPLLTIDENRTLIELFLKRLSVQFIEDNFIQDFTNILFTNFKTFNKLENKNDFDRLWSKFKDYYPELIVRLCIHFDQYENNVALIIKRRLDIQNSLTYLQLYWDKTFELNKLPYTFDPVNFPLSYHGLSSKEIFIKKSQFFRKICPELNYVRNLNYKNDKLKIGFISGFLNRIHSVYKDRHLIIAKLSNDFDVYVICDSDLNEDIKYTFNKAKFIKIKNEVESAKDTIEKLNLDLLVYCEIGMHPIYYFLAHLRLAKIQFNTWGHSDTSGINTIDYFITSKYYEDPISYLKNYSETPILLDSLCTCYVNPLKFHHVSNFKSRIELGYSNNVNIYLCSQSLFKLHPNFDSYIAGILDKDPDGIFILLDTFGNKKRIINRFEKSFKNCSRLHFVNGMKHFDYLNLIAVCDVMIDTYPFGGCNSSLEAFSLGRPVITQPSKHLNGRFTYGFYKKMNFMELIAYSKEDYINIAVKLGRNKNYNKYCSANILQKNNLLFEEEKSYLDWKHLILNCKKERKFDV